MISIFNNLGKQIYSANAHTGFVIKWSLVSPLCKKWSRNRDSDQDRVDEMIEHYTRGGYLPRIIHLAEIKGEGLVCYDGNHRREVLDKCHDDQECVVDVMFDATQADVYKAFANVNKAVQVPAIYIEDQSGADNSIKNDILQAVKEFEKQYKMYLSTSPRCHAPHFNRDTFTDNLFAIYNAFKGQVSVDKLIEALKRLNIEYSKGRICRVHEGYKSSVIDKCKKGGLWLFLEKTIPVEHVERVLRA